MQTPEGIEKERLFISVETKLDLVLTQLKTLQEHLDKNEENIIYTRADVDSLKKATLDIGVNKDSIRDIQDSVKEIKVWIKEFEEHQAKRNKRLWAFVGGGFSLFILPIAVYLITEWISRRWR